MLLYHTDDYAADDDDDDFNDDDVNDGDDDDVAVDDPPQGVITPFTPWVASFLFHTALALALGHCTQHWNCTLHTASAHFILHTIHCTVALALHNAHCTGQVMRSTTQGWLLKLSLEYFYIT